MYSIEIKPSCQKDIEKLCKKDAVLKEALWKKMDEIIKNPERYKPLKHGLANQKRANIMKSFVLKFEINEETKTVKFIFFGHHDDAYKR